MPEGDGAAVRVHVLRVVREPEVAKNGQGLCREGLVEFHDVDPADIETGASQNPSWILAGDVATFASSYPNNTAYDDCNGVGDATSPIRLLYRQAVP